MGSTARALTRHPDTRSPSVESVTVEVERSGPTGLSLRYYVETLLDTLTLAPLAEQARRGDLWRTTCFELFVRVPGHPDYAEYNFSPSSQWAAYYFDGYRANMDELDIMEPPNIGLDASETHFALEAIAELPAAWRTGSLEIAISVVIECTDGTKSYWALRHPSGPPDFHHPDCFALQLPPPE